MMSAFCANFHAIGPNPGMITPLLTRAATGTWLGHHGFADHSLHFLRHGEKHAALDQFTAAVEDPYEQAVSLRVGSLPRHSLVPAVTSHTCWAAGYAASLAQPY